MYMLCPYCRLDSVDNIKFCTCCGKAIPNAEAEGATLIGFSSRIHDPAFANYLKNTKRWAIIFALCLALIVVISFYIYGETSSEMDNPEALFIGLTIGGMFIAIAMLKIVGINRNRTWDGQIVDKKIVQKSRRRNAGNNDYYWDEYILYTVFIRSDSGKLHSVSAEDDDTVFNYFQIGDRVRHHGGLNSYEKYDKSQDDIIFCNACASLNDIHDNHCFRCNCPLLK